MTFEAFKKIALLKYGQIGKRELGEIQEYVKANAASEKLQHFLISTQNLDSRLKETFFFIMAGITHLDRTNLVSLILEHKNLDAAYSFYAYEAEKSAGYNEVEILINEDLFKMILSVENQFSKVYQHVKLCLQDQNEEYYYNYLCMIIDKMVQKRDWKGMDEVCHSGDKVLIDRLQEQVKKVIKPTIKIYDEEVSGKYSLDGYLLNYLFSKAMINGVENPNTVDDDGGLGV